MPTLTKIEFTEARVRNAAIGEHQDTKEKSLRLYVSNLHRSWGYYKWNAAKAQPVRRSLGKWPAVTVEDAREAARQMEKTLNAEAQPAPDKEPTISELILSYSAKLKLEKKKQWYWAEKMFDLCYKDWLKLPLSGLTRLMIEDRQMEVTAERGPQAATRALKALRALFNYAIKREVYTGKNTAKLVELVESDARTRVLTAAEKARFLDALNTPEFTTTYVSDFFRLLLLTGVRWGNLCSARWDEMVWEENVWVIPADKSKSGHEMRIGLRPEAIEILTKRMGAEDKHAEWVFPSPKKSSVGHLVEPSFAFARVLKMAEITAHTTVHDIRRTFGSDLVNKKVPLNIVAKALGHRNMATTQKHYGHVNDETVQWALGL